MSLRRTLRKAPLGERVMLVVILAMAALLIGTVVLGLGVMGWMYATR